MTKPCMAELSPDTCRLLVDVLVRVGDKWSMLVIVSLEEGDRRFSELRRALGISQKVLTSTLRGLERDGFVVRTVMPTKPPRVDYGLSNLGREVLPPVRALAGWAIGRLGVIEQARRRYDSRESR